MIPVSPRLAAAVLALTCLGCVAGQPAVPAPTPAASAPLTASMAGVVRLPMLALGTNGIIPTGIGAVIPAGGGASATHARSLMATAEERPVSGALVAALDPGTLTPLPGTMPVRTDANGSYTLAVPPGMGNVVVEAVFRSPDGMRAFRLLAAARPGAADDITWASTAAVASLLDASGHARPELATADLGPVQAAAAQRLASLTNEEAGAYFASELGIDAAQVPAGGVPGLLGSPPPVPAGLPSILPSPQAGITQPVASALGNVTTPVASALATVPSALPAAPAAVASTVGTVAGTVQAAAGVVQAVPSTVQAAPSTVQAVPSTVESLASTAQALPSVLPSVAPVPVPSTPIHL